jgi:trimeric autotransporter adhesin
MSGFAGNDTYFVDDAGDTVVEFANQGTDAVFSTAHFVLPANVETLVLQGNADLQGYGNELDNKLTGNAANNLLDGRGGADIMRGGAGNDSYFADNVDDVVLENAGEGTDTTFASVDLGLAPNVEVLVLLGSADLQGFGNALANMLYGNSGNNSLDGGAGADTMTGGLGNDTYVVDNGGDMVIENANEGTDTVFASAHFVLPANVENLTLQGGADLQGYGNSLANKLTGNSGNNLLDGRGGADTMTGGLGNDVYYVDSGVDAVVENPNEGFDTVYSTDHLVLGNNVENLILVGGDLQGYGNSLNNVLTGTDGANLLDGRGGSDQMIGGKGNDVYFVDSGLDAVFENPNEGFDTVYSTDHLVLGNNVENLILVGGDLQGYGNSLNNVLTGTDGANLLDGRGGTDQMIGGKGNDVYYVDVGTDAVIENPNEGSDAVFSTTHFTLPANVEILVLQGSADLQGYGNSLANSIYGNAGANLLDGGGGIDQLTGGAGNDVFLFRPGEGNGDTILDFAGNGAAVGDSLMFIGFGAGATFTNINAMHWQVNYNGNTSHDVITLSNGAAVDQTDVIFM